MYAETRAETGLAAMSARCAAPWPGSSAIAWYRLCSGAHPPMATIRCRSVAARPSRSLNRCALDGPSELEGRRKRARCRHRLGLPGRVLAEIAAKVFSIEIIPRLATRPEASGRARLRKHRSQDWRRLQGLAGEGARSTASSSPPQRRTCRQRSSSSSGRPAGW